jgi:hypothetical protein
MNRKRIGKPEIKKLRKVFYYKNDKTLEIKAGGVLFIHWKTNKEVLIQKALETNRKLRYSDFGGKVDDDDITIDYTIARELHEESNGGIRSKSTKEDLSIDELNKMMNDNIQIEIFIPFIKYLLKIVYFDDDKYEIDFNKTGTREKKDNIKRVVQWITYDDFIKYYNSKSLHPRISFPSILSFFKVKKFNFK